MLYKGKGVEVLGRKEVPVDRVGLKSELMSITSPTMALG